MTAIAGSTAAGRQAGTEAVAECTGLYNQQELGRENGSSLLNFKAHPK